MPEVLTSREAMHLQGDNSENDASAAAIILQSYLNKWNPPPKSEHDGEV
jgi:RNase H-fold protein (predicted Holliday junction resolvase)